MSVTKVLQTWSKQRTQRIKARNNRRATVGTARNRRKAKVGEARNRRKSDVGVARNERKSDVGVARNERKMGVGVARAETGSNLGGIINTALTGEQPDLPGRSDVVVTAPPAGDPGSGLPGWLVPAGIAALVVGGAAYAASSSS